MSDTAASITARKRWRCEEYRSNACFIEPGDVYVRLVAFPGDVNSGTTPWVMRLCASHYTQHGQVMPPARRARIKT